MPLTTHEQAMAAIKQELSRVNDDNTSIPDSELDNMANVVLAVPEEQREEYVVGFVAETLDRRRGDPRK